jgi:hypothetical protein
VTQCKDDRKEENCSASNGKAALAGKSERAECEKDASE